MKSFNSARILQSYLGTSVNLICFHLKSFACRVASGAMIIIIGIVARYLDLYAKENKYWISLLNCDKETKFPFLFHLQVCDTFQLCL